MGKDRLFMHTMIFRLVSHVRGLHAIASNWRRAVLNAFTDRYRPEMNYMRGPGPKWRERHGRP